MLPKLFLLAATGLLSLLTLQAVSDPNLRINALINQSEDSGPPDKARTTNLPSHMIYDRIHGGIQ